MIEHILEQGVASPVEPDKSLVDRLETPGSCVSGEWQQNDQMIDYRAEQLGDVFVERATWAEDTPAYMLRNIVELAAGHIWFRFWVLNTDQVIEKYFDAEGRALGIYVPVVMPIVRTETGLRAQALLLSLWVDCEGRIRILNEAHFDHAVQTGLLDQGAAEYAEKRIRELTLATSSQRFPSALIRNFALDLGNDRP